MKILANYLKFNYFFIEKIQKTKKKQNHNNKTKENL